MLPRPRTIYFKPHGRESVTARMKLLYGSDVIIIKCKHTARSALTLQNYTLSPDEFRLMFGSVVYDDWAGEPNILDITARLIAIEANRASVYLVFKP
jgi:hypothetical protein